MIFFLGLDIKKCNNKLFFNKDGLLMKYCRYFACKVCSVLNCFYGFIACFFLTLLLQTVCRCLANQFEPLDSGHNPIKMAKIDRWHLSDWHQTENTQQMQSQHGLPYIPFPLKVDVQVDAYTHTHTNTNKYPAGK